MKMETQEKPKLKLWKWLLLFVGAFLLATLGYALLGVANNFSIFVGIQLINIVAVAVVLLLYKWLVKVLEKHKCTDVPLGKLLPHGGLGLVIGFMAMAIAVSAIAALGCAGIAWHGSSFSQQCEALMLFMAVAVGEEMMFRGVMFRMIDERWGMWPALIVSSLLFGLVHITNANATWWAALAIAIEAGLMLGIAYKWSGTLWLPIGIHWAWNYTQGNVFGLAVSGLDSGHHILTTTVSGPDMITGGAFGPEASLVCTFLGLFIALVMLCNRAKS